LAVVILLKPDFTDVRKHFSLIWQENKAYGLHVYVGAITGVVSADLGGVSIGYFVDTTHVGFYSLALTTVMPLAMIPSVVGTTFFKDFANMNFIPRKVVAITLLLSIGTLLVFFIAIKYVILLFYSSAFAASIPLAYILSIAFTCNGYGDFINRFLAAHGRGREMRNSNFAICATNLFGYTFLVYAIGILGAAITKLCGSLMYLCMMNYYYRRYRKGVVQQ
jgi:O-antigen/teichoic acid export membrane protein